VDAGGIAASRGDGCVERKHLAVRRIRSRTSPKQASQVAEAVAKSSIN
jgi:hypothetical protein